VMFKKAILALGLMGLVTTPAMAAEDLLPALPDGYGTITGSAAITTEYFFRGISQTDDKPAFQLGFYYANDFGTPVTFNAGVWGSNVDFGAASDARVETDFTAGISGTFLDKGTWNVGGIYFAYPGSNDDRPNLDLDWYEGTVGAGYDFGLFTLGASFNYSPNFQLESGDAKYINANVKVPVGSYFDLVGSIGRQWIENNARFGTPDYTDYKIGGQITLLGFGVELAYFDTSMTEAQCPNCGQVVLTVFKNF
jgi:uncharacterized protein (TIGR02001 family)